MTCIMCKFPEWTIVEVMRRYEGDIERIKTHTCVDHKLKLAEQATKIKT